jgi:hypothetical protein
MASPLEYVTLDPGGWKLSFSAPIFDYFRSGAGGTSTLLADAMIRLPRDMHLLDSSTTITITSPATRRAELSIVKSETPMACH